MFCPNCGTENDSSALPCKKCGFKLSGVSTSKFKGTMMLNSDQGVQDAIDEHKRARAAAGALASDVETAKPPDAVVGGSRPPPAPPSLAPPASIPDAPKGVLQPPRAAATRRRMGGTMLGVAPQVGGITPAPPEVTVTPVPPQGVPAGSAAAHGAAPPVTPLAVDVPPVARRAADPLAGTVAMPAVPMQASRPGDVPGEARPAGRTQPLAAVPETPPHAAAEGPAYPAEQTLEPAAKRRNMAAFTAPMPEQPSTSAAVNSETSKPAPARGLRPIEIFLTVATCGLYGIVLLLRPRKP